MCTSTEEQLASFETARNLDSGLLQRQSSTASEGVEAVGRWTPGK